MSVVFNLPLEDRHLHWKKINKTVYSKDLEGKITTTQATISDLSSQIEETKQKIRELELILEDRQKKLARQGELRDTLVRTLYKKSQVSTLELILANDKFSELSQRLGEHRHQRQQQEQRQE